MRTLFAPTKPRLLAVAGLFAWGFGCAGASPVSPIAGNAGASATAPSGEQAIASSEAPDVADDRAIDLSITFDPRVSGKMGWAKLPKPVPLDMLGDLGAAFVSAVSSESPLSKGDPMRLAMLKAELAAARLADTSLILDEESVCSAELLAAVSAARPGRLLVSIEGGLTRKAAICLAALPTQRLYLAGCLHRHHRAEDTCDGDAELEALTRDEALRPRIRGLAASLARPESMARLAQLSRLEYLALSPGRGADESKPLFDQLPFAALGRLRYLEASGENPPSDFVVPEALRLVGQLHTLRWKGALSFDIPPPCRLERYSTDVLRAADVHALAGCTHLGELSTDGASFDSAEAVARFPALERLHLRHWKARSLAPLAALTNLRSLSLPASAARDFGFVSALTKLTSVDVSQSALVDVTPFGKLPSLQELDVGFTEVGDLSPLRSLAGLTVLDVHETKVVDLGLVAQWKSLRDLRISKTAVTDLRPLENHPSLERVSLYDSRVTDVSALLTLPKLKRAHIGGLKLPPDQVQKLRERLGHELLGAP